MKRRLVALGWAYAAVLCISTGGASAAVIDGDPLTISLNFKGETQVRFVAADVAELEPVSPPAPVVPSGLVLVLYSNDGHSATFCGSVHPGGGSSFVDGPTTSGSGTTADPFRIALTYDCSALRIVQTLEYVNGESEMTARYQVTNRTLQDAAFRVVTYANPHHGQSSLGDGLIDETAPRTLVSYNDAQGSAMAFVEDPSSPWSHYMQGTAADVQDAGLFTPFATGLADSVAQGADDDAVAVQFDKYHSSGLPAGATDTFIVHWAFDRYDGLAVVADAARHVVGQTASVTATSLNHGEPVQGATIRYSVTGANPAAGVVTTGPTGTSPIALTGRAAGLDTLSAYVDNDGDGNRDDDETRAATTLAWSAPASAAAPSGAATGTAPNSPDFASALRTGLAKAAARLQRMRKKALVRERRFSFRFTAPGGGLLSGTLALKGKSIARGAQAFVQPETKRVVIRLTRKGVRTLRAARHPRLRMRLTFAPKQGSRVSAVRAVALRRY